MTILEHFLKWEKEIPNDIFLRQPNGSDWIEYSWKETGKEVRKLLGALQQRGYKKGDKIALLSSNCAQWIICDLALMMGGYISVPLYANTNAKTMERILEDSEARLMFIGKLLPKDWDNLKDSIPSFVETVTFDGYERESFQTWSEFVEVTSPPSVTIPAASDIKTLIYTSGTTGETKGVIHTHGSIINAISTGASEVMFDRRGNRFVSYLPLCHSAERGLVEFGAIYSGGTIGFIESIDTFAANVQEIAPTHFFGVPRIWEKLQKKILEKIPEKRLSLLLKLPLAGRAIRSKIKKSLGLHNADVIISGAAPIAPDLIVWFQKLGIFIREAYGLSENFNVIALNPIGDIRIGTVGKIFDNQEVYIDPESNEIRQKSSWLMQGYFKKPELTAKTIVDGYLHTGDMGYLSEDGYLTVTGRVKDIFKTTKGVYISPASIEMNFLEMNIVDQACVMGSHYPQPFVLIVLSDIGKAIQPDQVELQLQEVIDKINSEAMEYQKIKKAIIVKEEWTNDNDMLTPTLKMKRNVLSKKYEAASKAIYEKDESVSWE